MAGKLLFGEARWKSLVATTVECNNAFQEEIQRLTKEISIRDEEISNLRKQCQSLKEENIELKLRIMQLENERDELIGKKTDTILAQAHLIPNDAEIIKENNDIYVMYKGFYWYNGWFKEKKPCNIRLVKTIYGYGCLSDGVVKSLWDGYYNSHYISYNEI